MYESTITFTLDTICPWTYLAKRRLDAALKNFSESSEASNIHFTVRVNPYQLYPDMPADGEDKRAWYMRTKYHGSSENMDMFASVMDSYAEPLGYKYNWDGSIANTLNAHRVIQYFQGGEDAADPAMEKKYGPDVAMKLVDALYRMYFEEGKHPSTDSTLLQACKEAGINGDDAKNVVEDKDEGLPEVKMMVRMSGMNGLDAVPNITIEGRRRDLSLVGAKETDEYEKALATIAKESS